MEDSAPVFAQVRREAVEHAVQDGLRRCDLGIQDVQVFQEEREQHINGRKAELQSSVQPLLKQALLQLRRPAPERERIGLRIRQTAVGERGHRHVFEERLEFGGQLRRQVGKVRVGWLLRFGRHSLREPSNLGGRRSGPFAEEAVFPVTGEGPHPEVVRRFGLQVLATVRRLVSGSGNGLVVVGGSSVGADLHFVAARPFYRGPAPLDELLAKRGNPETFRSRRRLGRRRWRRRRSCRRGGGGGDVPPSPQADSSRPAPRNRMDTRVHRRAAAVPHGTDFMGYRSTFGAANRDP